MSFGNTRGKRVHTGRFGEILITLRGWFLTTRMCGGKMLIPDEIMQVEEMLAKKLKIEIAVQKG